MAGQSGDHALDHMVVVVFENRSLDNVLGRLYGPEDGKTFDGVIGKDLTNPIPEWAEHGADRKVVPYTVATDMDSPNPDTGEEYPHTNTQLFNILPEANRFKLGEEISAPYNAPEPGQTPTMDGFVTDYISTLTAELGRQPTYEEYSQVMTGFTPEQIPAAERPGARIRRVRPLVLRGAVPDVHQPVILDRSPGFGRTRARYPPTSRTHSASARPYPPSAPPFSPGYGHTPSSTTSRSRDYPPTPKPRSPQNGHSTSSITSSPSNSPCCTPPPRDPPPQPDPPV